MRALHGRALLPGQRQPIQDIGRSLCQPVLPSSPRKLREKRPIPRQAKTTGPSNISYDIPVLHLTLIFLRSSSKSQYAEKVRLQSLVSSPEWDLQGRVDMYVFGKLLGQGKLEKTSPLLQVIEF